MQWACALLYFHLWPIWLYHTFPHYLINDTILGKKYWTQIVCFDFLYNFYLKRLSFCEEMSEIWSKIYVGLHVKYALFMPVFNKIFIISTSSWKILKCQILWKPFRLEPSWSMRTGRRTDKHDEANSRLSQFWKTRIKRGPKFCLEESFTNNTLIVPKVTEEWSPHFQFVAPA